MNIQFDKAALPSTMKRKVEPSVRKRDASIAEKADVTNASDSKSQSSPSDANYADGATLLRKSSTGSVQSLEQLIKDENSTPVVEDRRGMIIDVLV